MTFSALRLRALAALRVQIANGRYSERELARRAGVSQPQVHHVLNGKRDASLAVLDRLVAAAQIDVVKLTE